MPQKQSPAPVGFYLLDSVAGKIVLLSVPHQGRALRTSLDRHDLGGGAAQPLDGGTLVQIGKEEPQVARAGHQAEAPRDDLVERLADVTVAHEFRPGVRVAADPPSPLGYSIRGGHDRPAEGRRAERRRRHVQDEFSRRQHVGGESDVLGGGFLEVEDEIA